MNFVSSFMGRTAVYAALFIAGMAASTLYRGVPYATGLPSAVGEWMAIALVSAGVGLLVTMYKR